MVSKDRYGYNGKKKSMTLKKMRGGAGLDPNTNDMPEVTVKRQTKRYTRQEMRDLAEIAKNLAPVLINDKHYLDKVQQSILKDRLYQDKMQKELLEAQESKVKQSQIIHKARSHLKTHGKTKPLTANEEAEFNNNSDAYYNSNTENRDNDSEWNSKERNTQHIQFIGNVPKFNTSKKPKKTGLKKTSRRTNKGKVKFANQMQSEMEAEMEAYMEPEMQAQMKADMESHNITHIKYTKWPDHGTPNMDVFNQFIITIYDHIKKYRGSTLIHCSAGIGRTGVVYVILSLLFKNNFSFNYVVKTRIEIGEEISELLKKQMHKSTTPKQSQAIEEELNELNTELEELEQKIEYKIFKTVVSAKKHRNKDTVQTYEQFVFICNFFGIKKPKLSEQEYFQPMLGLINMLKPEDQKELKAIPDIDSKIICNKNDRYSNILPSQRVILNTIPGINNILGVDCSDYINASHMKPFIYQDNNGNNDDNVIECNVIAAMCPKPNTFNQFYRMLSKTEQNIRRIIMVTDYVDARGKKCDDYIYGQPLSNEEEEIKKNQDEQFHIKNLNLLYEPNNSFKLILS